jgi:uncharacterized lipoprotein YddW (UPF0748 family)
VFVSLLACSLLGAQALPSPRREFRAAWVATVDNIDWPSRPGLLRGAAQAELTAIVARAQALRLNALLFQVRPCADAMYASELEPWSEWLTGATGRPPAEAWDPFAFLIEHAHRAGLEVHAWFNPYRAWHTASRSAPSADHVLRKLPDACVAYGEQKWMDPGDPRALDWTMRVIADVVRRYDLDGVQVDDYFYPYKVGKQDFPDDGSFARYRQGGGRLGRADWRRANIDAFVWRFHGETHAQKPWVKVGISPFGIARPGLPKGIQAGVDQYEGLYADVLGWLTRGEVDYLAPQLYWPIDQKPQSFAVLLPWWIAQNPKRRHIWPGLSAGRAAARKPPTRKDELLQQIDMVRAQAVAPGHVLFSFKALANDGPVAEQLRAAYPEIALVPVCGWLGGKELAAPPAKLERDGQLAVRWEPLPEARFACIQVLRGGRWHVLAVVGAEVAALALPQDAKAVAVRFVDRFAVLGAAAIATP